MSGEFCRNLTGGKFNVDFLSLFSRGIPLVSQDRSTRIDAIGTMLGCGDYDLVSLQEVWSEGDYHKIKDKVKRVLPYTHYFYR